MSATPKPRFHATGDANLVSGAFTLVIPELGASGADACTQVDMFMLTVMERAKGERVVVLLGDCCSNMRNKAMVQGIPATLVATGEFDAVFIIYLWQLHSKHLADANFGATYNEVRRRDIFIPEEWGAAAMRISVDDGGIITNDINADNSAFMLNSAAQTQWCRFFEQFFILGGGVATEDKSLAFKQSNYHIIGARSVAALDNIEDSELRGFVQRFASAPPGWLAMQTLPSPGSFVRVWNPFRGALKPWSKKTGNGPPKKKAKTDAAPNFTDFEQPLAKKVEVWDEAAAAAAAANAGAAASAAGATAVLPSHADYSPTQAAYGASARCAAAAKAAATSAWTLQQIVSLKRRGCGGSWPKPVVSAIKLRGTLALRNGTRQRTDLNWSTKGSWQKRRWRRFLRGICQRNKCFRCFGTRKEARHQRMQSLSVLQNTTATALTRTQRGTNLNGNLKNTLD